MLIQLRHGRLAPAAHLPTAKYGFICHYHFLRDIGNDLLDRDYQAIRNRLSKHGISGKLQYRAKRLKMQIDQHPELIGDFVHSLQHATETSAHRDSIPLLSAYNLIQWALAGKKQGGRLRVSVRPRPSCFCQASVLRVIHANGSVIPSAARNLLFTNGLWH